VYGASCDVGELGRLCDNTGRDTLTGGPGDDHVYANECMPDPNCQEATNISLGTTMSGGPGTDVMLGAHGRDVIRGERGKDTAAGYLGRDLLRGGGGDDALDGGGGNDRAYGKAGTDRVSGGGGRDLLRGGKGYDTVTGGAGNDRLYGSAGEDRLSGGPGNDRIFARGSQRDRVICGKGRDRAKVDRLDKVSGCERVLRLKPLKRPRRRR
jgi:Ca2+-binding RTX toxin-like protein